MKTDLSSQITLTRIPQRYYRPENAFEHSVLTRLEKIPANIYESADEGSFAIAKEIADQIRKKQEIGENFVMAIPGGRSPLSVYKELIRINSFFGQIFKSRFCTYAKIISTALISYPCSICCKTITDIYRLHQS